MEMPCATPPISANGSGPSAHNCAGRNRLQKQTAEVEEDGDSSRGNSCSKCSSSGGGADVTAESTDAAAVTSEQACDAAVNNRRQQLNRTPAVSVDEHSVGAAEAAADLLTSQNRALYPDLGLEMERLQLQLHEFLSMRDKGEEVQDTVKDDMIKFMENVFTDPAKLKDKQTLLACYDFLQKKLSANTSLLDPNSLINETRFLDDDPRTRMLMHKLCAFLGLDHNIVGPHQKDTMIIQRKENFRNWKFDLHQLSRFYDIKDFMSQIHSREDLDAGGKMDPGEDELAKGATAKNTAAGGADKKRNDVLTGHRRMTPKSGWRHYHSQPTRDDSINGKNSPAAMNSLRRHNTDNSEMSSGGMQPMMAAHHSTLEVPNRNVMVPRNMYNAHDGQLMHAPSNNSSMDDSGMYSPQSGSPCPGQPVHLSDDMVVWRLVSARVADLHEGDWVFYGQARYPAQLVRQDGSPYTHTHVADRVAYIPTSRAATPVGCLSNVKLSYSALPQPGHQRSLHTPPPNSHMTPPPITPQQVQAQYYQPAQQYPPPPMQMMQSPATAPMMIPIGVQQGNLRHSASLDSINGVGYQPVAQPPPHGYSAGPVPPQAQYMPQPVYPGIMPPVHRGVAAPPQGYTAYLPATGHQGMSIGLPMPMSMPMQQPQHQQPTMHHGVSTT